MAIPSAVIVHPLVLLSVVDHWRRSARDTRKRVVGVLLGERVGTGATARVDVTNSFAGECVCGRWGGGRGKNTSLAPIPMRARNSEKLMHTRSRGSHALSRPWLQAHAIESLCVLQRVDGERGRAGWWRGALTIVDTSEHPIRQGCALSPLPAGPTLTLQHTPPPTQSPLRRTNATPPSGSSTTRMPSRCWPCSARSMVSVGVLCVWTRE